MRLFVHESHASTSKRARFYRLTVRARFMLKIDIGAKYVDLSLIYQAESHHFHVPNPLGCRLSLSARVCIALIYGSETCVPGFLQRGFKNDYSCGG
jgi:hypothetical protein